MNSISDPGRPSRGDRRRTQKLIDTAFAEGRLTAADRALRSERIASAHSKGDLATITRDLTAPSTARLGTAINPATLSGMKVGGTRPRSMPGGIVGTPGGATLDLSKMVGSRIKWIVLAVVLGVFGSCFLGFFGLVASMFQSGGVTSSDPVTVTAAPPVETAPIPAQPDAPGEAPAAVGLHTAKGWSALVRAIDKESGTTEVYDAVVYPEYASLGLDGKGSTERRLYRDGGWQSGFEVKTPVIGSLVDLGKIDPAVWSRLPAKTAEHFGVENPVSEYMIVNAYAGTPQIMVYVQSDAGSQYRTYDLAGNPQN